MKSILKLLMSFLPLVVAGQVEVREPVKLSGNTSQERQVSGLAPVTAQGDLADAQSVQANRINFAVTSGTSTNIILNTPLLTTPDTGHIVYFMAGAVNTGPVSVSLNGGGNFPLLKFGSVPLDSGDLALNLAVGAVFTGSAFQMITPVYAGCPTGFVAVNDNYCIQENEQDSLDWYLAVQTCYGLNARLCNLGEWYQACMNATSLGLSDMQNNNWEWINSSGNTTAQANVMGKGTTGAVACSQGNSRMANEANIFRCCYSRKR